MKTLLRRAFPHIRQARRRSVPDARGARTAAVSRASAMAAIAFFGVVASACGAAVGGTSVASLGTTTTAGAASAASGAATAPSGSPAAKYVSCMRSHGVLNFPSPALGAGGSAVFQLPAGMGSSEAFRQAYVACQYLAPGVPAGGGYTTQQQAAYLSAAQCMRAHGLVGFPDPVFHGPRVVFPLPQGMNVDATPFRRARVVCEKLIPPGLPYSS